MAQLGELTTNVDDMYAVHQAIIGAFDAADDLVARSRDDHAHADAVSSFYENVIEFLHVHHGGEDELIYPKLRERCPDSWPTIDHIDQQHQTLNAPMAQAREVIAAWRANPTGGGGAAVAAALDLIDETLRPHLSAEEEIVLPFCRKWITQEEWSELPGHAMAAFTGDKPWLGLGLVRERLTQAQRDGMLSSMPPPLQDLWVNQWGPAFDAFIADVRR